MADDEGGQEEFGLLKMDVSYYYFIFFNPIKKFIQNPKIIKFSIKKACGIKNGKGFCNCN